MACACKVNQQIEYLQKRYGHNMPKSRSTNIRGMVSLWLKQAGLWLIAIPFIPLMIIGLIFHLIFRGSKPIEIDKTFRLKKKNVRA